MCLWCVRAGGVCGGGDVAWVRWCGRGLVWKEADGGIGVLGWWVGWRGEGRVGRGWWLVSGAWRMELG